MVKRLVTVIANRIKRREEDRVDRHLWTQLEALTGPPRRPIDQPRLRLVKRQRLH